MMASVYEWTGFIVLWGVVAAAVGFALLFTYFRWLHGRFGTLGGKNRRQLSIAAWHDSVLGVKGVKGKTCRWQVDDYPFAWLHGLAYRMPWSGRSLVLIIGATDKARFRNLTGNTHPREGDA